MQVVVVGCLVVVVVAARRQLETKDVAEQLASQTEWNDTGKKTQKREREIERDKGENVLFDYVLKS